MSLFGVLPVAGSGADAMQTWIDTSAGNIANMDDTAAVGTPAYAEQTPVFTPAAATAVTGGGTGDGVEVSQIAEGTTTGVVASDPSSPLANAQGEVVLPNITLADQMVGMIEAQESYQADTVVMQRAQAMYTAGLSIGT